MIKAGFISSAPHWHWRRQFPGSEAIWNGVKFQFEGDLSTSDIVFVFDAIPPQWCGKIRAKKAVFVCSEPRNVKTYREDFLAQFDVVITSDPKTKHPNLQLGQVGLPWLVGAWNAKGEMLEKPMSYDDFLSYMPVKKKLISVVSSDKAFTPEHRQRLGFVELLKSHFGDHIDYFGRNINGFGDKTEVLSEYKYHIALENCSLPNYWTEKLADPLLTLTYPIYHGCLNIYDYFSKSQLWTIDISDPVKSIQHIDQVINRRLYEKHMPDLIEARNTLMSRYNIFAILSQTAHDTKIKRSDARTLESEFFFSRNKSIIRKMIKRNLVRPLRAGLKK